MASLLILSLLHLGSISKHWNMKSVLIVTFKLSISLLILFISYKLNIWDVGGQKSIRSYWRNYFEQTDALVWVVDSADRLRLMDCKRELAQLLQEERLAGATLLVFANKQDIAGALTEIEIKNALGLDDIKSHHWAILPCSAVTGDNLLKGMDWVVNDVASRIYMLE